jgi:hypothetical protein
MSDPNQTKDLMEGMLNEKFKCNVWAEAIDAVRFVVHTSQREIVVDDLKGRSALKWVEDINMYALMD